MWRFDGSHTTGPNDNPDCRSSSFNLNSELDPVLAAIAAKDTGRRVIVGDFTTVAIDVEPTVIVGNPPFSSEMIAAFIRCAATLLPALGRAAFLVPVHSFSFAGPTLQVLRVSRCRWTSCLATCIRA